MAVASDHIDRSERSGVPPQLIIVAGVALNGFAVLIARSWQAESGPSLLLGISPFELIALGVALVLLRPGLMATAPATIGVAEVLLAAAMLIPSSTAAWSALAGYGAWLALRHDGDGRKGALILVLLALASLWSGVGIRLVGDAVTLAEARLIHALMGLAGLDTPLAGTAIGPPDQHHVVLMPACTSLQVLPKALLGLVALALGLGQVSHLRLALAGGLLALVVVLANSARVAVMTFSLEHFHLAHGAVGSNIFDVVAALSVFAGASLAVRR